jgi:hypothetical protein
MTTPGSGLDINLARPEVQRLLDPEEAHERGIKKNMVHLGGDPERGYHSTHRLDVNKLEVYVTYKQDLLLTVDVYPAEGPDKPLEIHYVCPRCTKQGRITSEMKAMEFDPTDNRPLKLPNGQITVTGGRLSVEPFQCTHELPEHVKHVQRAQGGLTLCLLRIAIDNNVAKDA